MLRCTRSTQTISNSHLKTHISSVLREFEGTFFGNSSSRAYTSSFTQSLAHVGSTIIPAPRGGKLCLDNCIEKKGTKMKANITHRKRQWNLWAKAIMETRWHYILTHGTVFEKKKSCICHPLGAAPCRTSQYTYLLTWSSRPKSEAEADS